jgi:hypothetical protein
MGVRVLLGAREDLLLPLRRAIPRCVSTGPQSNWTGQPRPKRRRVNSGTYGKFWYPMVAQN